MKKNYFKKSLSLVLTVLMLMSCWVFVPGEHQIEAEARATINTYREADKYGTPVWDGTNTYYSKWNSGSSYTKFTWPKHIYLDLSETLQSAGYYYTVEWDYGNGTDYRIVNNGFIFGGWRLQGGNWDNFDNFHTMNNMFTGYDLDASTHGTQDGIDGESSTAFDLKIGGDNWDGAQVIIWRNPSNDNNAQHQYVFMKGTPKKVGEGRYSTSGAKPNSFGGWQYWSNGWKNASDKYTNSNDSGNWTTDCYEGTWKEVAFDITIYDKATLNTHVTSANTIYDKNSEYSSYALAGTWTTFINERSSGTTLLKTRATTNNAITTKANSLNNAINALRFGASNEALRTAVDKAQALQSKPGYNTLYTQASRDALATAIKNATESEYYTNATYYASEYSDAGSRAATAKTAINNLTAAVDTAINGLKRQYDVGYDNLFSLTDWAVSTYTVPSNGTVDVDAPAGTITITHDGSTAGTDNNTDQNPGDGWYKAPVEGDTEYVLTWETSGNGRAQIHAFFATGTAWTNTVNTDAPWFVESGDLPYSAEMKNHTVTFTTPAETDGIVFRFGTCNSGDSVTFSNIRLVKKSDYDAYAKDYTKIREPFKVGDTTRLMTPSRDGYRFDGWFTADGKLLTSVDGLYESDTVYAQWTKLHTVTFLNGDGSTFHTVDVGSGSTLTDDQYPVTDPDKASDANYSYSYTGWDYDGSAVTSDITVKPVFTSKAHTNYTYSRTAYSPATCEQNAIVAKYCADCSHDFGKVVFDGDIEAYPQYKALDHDYDGQPAIQGSANDNGQHLVRCVRYDVCRSEKYVDHVWNFVDTTDATCVNKGTNHYKCACQAVKDETGVVAPDVHEHTELINFEAPTCLADGYTGDTYCTDCKTTVVYGEVDPKLGHDWKNTNTFAKSAATCTDDAVYWQECTRCNISAESDTTNTGSEWTDTGSKLGHTWENTKTFPKSEADCENDAVYYQECSVCKISAENDTLGTGDTWTEADTSKGHDYTSTIRNNNNGTHSYLCANGCDTYGYNGVKEASTACNYGEWDTTGADNHIKTCEDCDYEFVEAHEWSAWKTVDGATDKDEAQHTRSCSICGKIETADCDYKSVETKETCTEDGYTTHTCTTCSHEYVTAGTTKTGHDYTSGNYKYDTNSDTHQQLCVNGCGTYGVGTEEDATEACDWTYANKEDGKHTASCVCGNSQEEACTGGTATCTTPATCEKCKTAYGSTAPHSFTGTPVVLDGDKHAYRCVYCNGDTIYGVGENQGYTEACSGGTATCSALAVCDICKDGHGEINPDNHKWGDPANIDGTLTHKYICQYNSDHEKTEDCVCTSPSVLAPDCETAGYQQNYCDDCGHGWQTNPEEARGHDWSNWISNEDGTHTRTCERAGCVYNTENPGTAKTETVACTKENATYVVTDPTCLDKGYTTYTCKDCSYEWVDDYVDATGHSYINKTKKTDAVYKRTDKDCTTDETYWYVCDNCNVSAGTEKDKYDDETVLYWVSQKATDHKYDKKNAAAEYLKDEATCTTSAVYYYSCSACGASSEGTDGEKTFESGSALGHDWTDTKTYPKSEADCINDAVYYKECSRCNISSKGETNATWTDENTKTGHDFDHDDDGIIGNEGDTGYVAKVDATCTEAGNLEYYNCSTCGKNFADEDATTELDKVVIAVLGHDWVSVAYKAASCEEDGHSSHKECSRCGTKNADYEVREKTGHNFSGAYTYDPIYNYHSRYCVNTNCLADGEKAYGIGDEKYSVELDVVDYVIKGGEACAFDSYTTTTDENGLHSHNLECVCGNAQTRVISADDITTEVVDPTCTEDGYTLNTCNKDDCGKTWNTDIVGKLDHDLKGTATSNGNGTHSVKCVRDCGYSADAEKCSTETPSTTCGTKNECDICGGEFGEEIPHVFTKYEYNNNATCTADGTETAECDNCDTGAKDTRTAEGTKLGHNMSAHGYDISGWVDADGKSLAPESLDVSTIKEPTCGAEGLSISYCSRCDVYVTKTVPKNKDAHKMAEEWTLVGGNCATGVTFIRACEVCGKKESKTENVPHDWKAIVIEEAGCTVNGYINFECTVCGFTATLDDTVDTWPSFNGVDYTDKNIVASGNHTWQTEAPVDEDYIVIDGVIVFVEKYPAYNSTGRGYKKCAICSAIEAVTIAAYGNNPTNHKHPELGINDNSTLKYVAQVDPTCNVGGHKGYYECTRCSYSQYVLDHDAYYIAALGHTAPNSKGKCDRCKTTIEEEDSASKNCGCICHKESGFMKFIYKILSFFWKLFGMNKNCKCGIVHY